MATTDAGWHGPDPNDELPEGWGLLTIAVRCAAAIGGAVLLVRAVVCEGWAGW